MAIKKLFSDGVISKKYIYLNMKLDSILAICSYFARAFILFFFFNWNMKTYWKRGKKCKYWWHYSFWVGHNLVWTSQFCWMTERSATVINNMCKFWTVYCYFIYLEPLFGTIAMTHAASCVVSTQSKLFMVVFNWNWERMTNCIIISNFKCWVRE